MDQQNKIRNLGIKLPLIHTRPEHSRRDSLFIILVLLCVPIGLSIWLFVLNSAPIQRFLLTNVTPTTTTFTWYTQRPNRGCVLALKWPPTLACDPQGRPVTNHHITVANLDPAQSKNFLVLSGKSFLNYKLSPGFIPDSVPALPNPAYGQIISPDTGEPVPQATIIAFTLSGPVSTLTDAHGYWSLDLRGTYPKNKILPLRIIWGDKFLTTHQLTIGLHQPTPAIELQEAFRVQN